ncbi:MAG: PAS domain-containing protein, partial [Thiohalomonadaceae bacterium]
MSQPVVAVQGKDGRTETTRLQNRIVAFALAAILITGLAVGLGTAIPAFHSAKAALESAVDYNVRLQALAIGQFTTRLGDMALQVTSRSVIRDRLEDYVHGRIDLAELRAFSEPKLKDALILHPEAVGMVRLGPAGETLVTIGEVPPGMDWPLPAGATPLIAPPHHHAGESYLAAAAAIFGRDGARIGTDVVVFRDKVLHTILSDLEELLPGATIFVVAPGGHAYLHPRGSLVPRELPPNMRDMLARGARGMLHAGDDVLFAAGVSGGWALLVSLPDVVVYAPALEELAVPALAMLLMLLAAFLGTNRLLRPLAARAIGLAERLQTTSAEQQAMLEYAHSFVFHVSDGRLGTVSGNVREVLGFGPDELPAELVDRLIGLSHDAVGEGELPSSRLHATRADGRARVLEVNARVAVGPGGHREMFGVARDITARVQAEEALRASEERLRTLIDASPDLICFKDGQGRCLEVNQSGRALLGFDEGLLLGRSCVEMAQCMRGEMRDMMLRFAANDEQAWQIRAPLRLEESIPGPAGERILDTIRVPLFDDQGNRNGLLTLGRDVTERVLAERELARSAAEWTYAMDFLEDAIFLVDSDRRVLRANHAAYLLVDGAPSQVVGKVFAEVLYPEGIAQPCRVCEALVHGRDAFITVEMEHADNAFGRPVEVMVKVIPAGDGNPQRTLIGIHDLSRTRKTEEELRLAA